MTDRKETITRTANAEFAHKKQIGGGGEFALVRLRLNSGDTIPNRSMGSE